MAQIDDLDIPNLENLSDEELVQLIRGVRARRRDTTSEAHKEAVKKVTTRKKKGKPVPLMNIEDMLKGMGSTDREELLAKLNAMQNKGE